MTNNISNIVHTISQSGDRTHKQHESDLHDLLYLRVCYQQQQQQQ